MEEKEQKSKIIKWAKLILVGLFLISFIYFIGSGAVDFLKNYSGNQEKKDIIKFFCSKTGGFNDSCIYDESNNEWQYEVMPKTEEEVGTMATPEKKLFTKQKDCVDFCYKDFLKTDKKFLDTMLSKEIIEEVQKQYPELQKSLWYKLNNWLERL